MKLRCAMALAALTPLLPGATTQTWEMTSLQDFIRGKLRGVALTKDGRLLAGPAVQSAAELGSQQLWTAIEWNGRIVAGTGHRGEIRSAAGVLWTAPEPEIFALAAAPGGALFAGTSPHGKIYRIDSSGRAEEYFAPKERYIWALAVAADGTLYAATGDQGRIYRVTGKGAGGVWYECNQANVTALALDRAGNVLAGAEPNGIVYRIGQDRKPFVLFDSSLPEIRSLTPMADGSVIVAAMGGSVSKRANASSSAISNPGPVTAAPISITVTADNAQAGPDIKPKAESKPAAPSTALAPAPAPASEITGVEKSAIFRIAPDLTVEKVWASKEDNVYAVAPEAGGRSILAGSDYQGRIYRIAENRQFSLVAEIGDGEIVALSPSPGGIVAASSSGRVFRLSEAKGTGTFESPVHDASTVVRWGKLTVRGTIAGIECRSGNSGKPDSTWSEWTKPRANGQVASPNARFIQWRAHFDPSSELESVSLAYLPQNSAPVVRGIVVSAGAAPKTASPPAAAASGASFSVTVTDTGEASTPAGTLAQIPGRGPATPLQIAWQAEDPDGDRLSYRVYFRGEGEREWKLLRENFADTTLPLEGDMLADGRYFFRVVASDQPSNDPRYAREAELISAPVLIDNTPPAVAAVWREGRIEVSAKDATTPLKRCEFSVDAGPWVPVEAEDGITDSQEERFVITPLFAKPGEHVVVIRVYDAAGNAGLARVVVR